MLSFKEIDEYRGYRILQYESENGYRVDFGTLRSKLVATIEEARGLIDFALSPDKGNELKIVCSCGNSESLSNDMSKFDMQATIYPEGCGHITLTCLLCKREVELTL